MSITVTGIVIVLILIAFFVIGMKTGLIKSVIDLFAFFLTWTLTWILYPYLASFLIKTPVYDAVKKWLIITLDNNDVITQKLPDFFVNLPKFIKDSIIISSKQTIDNLLSSAVDALAVLTINVISIVALYLILRVLSMLIKKLGKKINKIIIIGPVNKVLGGAFGIVKGFFIIYIAMILISCFPTTKIYHFVEKDIEKCIICSKMFNEDVKFLGLSVGYPGKEE